MSTEQVDVFDILIKTLTEHEKRLNDKLAKLEETVEQIEEAAK